MSSNLLRLTRREALVGISGVSFAWALTGTLGNSTPAPFTILDELKFCGYWPTDGHGRFASTSSPGCGKPFLYSSILPYVPSNDLVQYNGQLFVFEKETMGDFFDAYYGSVYLRQYRSEGFLPGSFKDYVFAQQTTTAIINCPHCSAARPVAVVKGTKPVVTLVDDHIPMTYFYQKREPVTLHTSL